MANAVVIVIFIAVIAIGTLGQQETSETRQSEPTILTNDMGSIQVDEMVTGKQWRMWVLEWEGQGSQVERMHIDLNITRLYLPPLSPILHSQDMSNNVSSGDFLLIGVGQALLSGNTEAMFFGVLGEERKIHIRGPSAHLYLQLVDPPPNSPSRRVALTIHYQRTVIPTTLPPTTTTPAPTFSPSNHSAYIDLNGIALEYAMSNDYHQGVKQAAAAILTQHFAEQNLTLSQNESLSIMEEDVLILDTRKCPGELCGSDCVAYKIMCVVKDEETAVIWVSERPLLVTLFANESLHHYWNTYVPGNVWVCNSELYLTTSVWVVIGVMLFLVVILNVVVLYMRKDSARRRFEAKYNEVEEEKANDRKRKNSETASVLGLGTVASRTSRKAVRLPTHPQERDNNKNSDEDSDGEVTDSDHVILDDPDDIALSPLPTRTPFPAAIPTPAEPRSYINPAFLDDDELCQE